MVLGGRGSGVEPQHTLARYWSRWKLALDYMWQEPELIHFVVASVDTDLDLIVEVEPVSRPTTWSELNTQGVPGRVMRTPMRA